MSRVFIDTNIPMYAAGTPHRLREPSQQVIRSVAAGRLDAVTDVEVFQDLHQTHHHLLRIVLILFGIKHHWRLFAPIRELKDISVAHGEQIQEVERTRQELIITDRGKPVLKIMPYSDDPHEVLKKLRGSLLKYEDPTEPAES